MAIVKVTSLMGKTWGKIIHLLQQNTIFRISNSRSIID
jgi:hypothetical protein